MEVNSTRRNARDHVDDLRGVGRLAIDATRGVTELVEAVHTAIARGPIGLGRPFTRPVELTSRLVYSSQRRGKLMQKLSRRSRLPFGALRLAVSRRARRSC